MRTKNPFWWFSAAALGLTFATAGFIAFLFWNQLALDEKAIFLEIIQGRFIYFFGAGFVLFLGFGLILDGIFHLYILPIKRLNEELQVMQSVHPGHRIKGKGEGWFGDISRRLNTWADRTETMQKEVEKQIGLARAEIEEERNIFAAILSELPQGVLICNAEGRILLYDQQSRAYLETEPLASNGADLSKGAGHFIGLGRSIFGVMDKYRLVHALDEIALKLERKDPGVSSRFIMVGPKGNLLQVEVVPVLDPCDRLCTGFALILEDITKRMAEEAKIDGLLQELTTGIRTSVAAIRSAAEAMIAYPEMESAKRNRFQEIILEESLAIGQRVNLTASDYPSRLFGRWPLVRTTASDFAEAVRRQAQSKLGIAVEIHGESRKEWIGLDSYSALLAMLFLLNRLKPRAQPPVFTMELEKEETFLCLDLHWNGEGVSMETLRTWDAEILSVGGEAIPLPLGEIIRHHGAEIFPLKGRKGPQTASLRILIPAVKTFEEERPRMPMTLLPGSRPEFFDFDLFHHYGQASELDERPLSEITFTAFDTETTGLDLRGGDEIISIGGVRIVNGRLLREEIFDRLVDPGRPVSPESVRIHGISSEMLKGQPSLQQVLPLFHRFARGTVLVAHNAAFDMQMIKLKESISGVRFTNPVLDTLLLSAAMHPSQENHNLETVARRLGVSVMGRHTALGDAIVAGEIFLKLMQLLEQAGIRTLKEARALSKKTFYARKRY